MTTNRFRYNIGKNGILRHGEDLTVHVEGAKSVQGVLFSKKLFGWKVIQVDQSGTSKNPDKDRIQFEMVRYSPEDGRLQPLPRGRYKVRVWAFGAGSSYAISHEKKFAIE